MINYNPPTDVVAPNIFKPRNDCALISLFAKKYNPKEFKPGLIQVLREVCEAEKVKIDMVKSSTRKRNIVEARQMYFKRARQVTKFTYREIGEFVGKKHCTVIYGVNLINSVPKLLDRYERNFLKTKKITTIRTSIVNDKFDYPIKFTSPYRGLETTNNQGYSGYRQHQL